MTERSGRWFAAACYLDQFLKEEPSDPALRLRHGLILARLGRWSEAGSDLVEACKLMTRPKPEAKPATPPAEKSGDKQP